MMKDVKDVN